MPHKPKGWPSDVTYITTNRCSSSIRKSLGTSLISLCPPETDKSKVLEDELPSNRFLLPSTHVYIQEIVDSAHPAVGQKGLFAACALQPGSFVIDYLGFIHTDDESDLASDYDLKFGKVSATVNDLVDSSRAAATKQGTSLGIDAANFGNEARFINDYRQVPRPHRGDLTPRKDRITGPNCEFNERVARNVSGSLELRMSVFTVSGKKGHVSAGEELLVSYGKGFWGARELRDSLLG